MSTNHIIREFKREESEEYGEELVQLVAIGWELYSLRVNGYEEQRIVGLDNAMNALEDWVNEDDPSWKRIA